jgi:hypothetical protein
MLERVKARQMRQEEALHDLASILPLLIPEAERDHLVNLDKRKTQNYEATKSLQDELRHLRAIGLISMKKGHIGDMNGRFDLAEYVELTPSGWRWIDYIRECEIKNIKPQQPQKNADQ